MKLAFAEYVAREEGSYLEERMCMVGQSAMAEEQGWVARMVHLFRSDNLGVQFEVRFPVSLFCDFSDSRTDSSNSTAPFRDRWRSYAFHIPRPHHLGHQALQTV